MLPAIPFDKRPYAVLVYLCYNIIIDAFVIKCNTP
jgi:hypothetical protein